MSKPKILITGCSGYLGQQIFASATDSGFSAVGTSRGPAALKTPFVQADLLRKENLETLLDSVDVVLHCAAVTRSNDPKQLFQGNQAVVMALIKALKIRPQIKLIFFSTDQAIGPIGAYGHSKLECEASIQSGLENYSILRLGAILGDYQPEGNSTFSKLTSQLLKKSVMLLPQQGRFLMPLSLYQDIWNLIKFLLCRPQKEALLINCFRYYELHHVLKLLAEGLPRSAKIIPVPLGPIKILAKVMIAANLLPKLPWVGLANIGSIAEPRDGIGFDQFQLPKVRIEDQIQLMLKQLKA